MYVMCCDSASAVVLTSLASGRPHHHLRVSVTCLGDAMGVLSPRAHAGDDATCSLCDVLLQRLGCGSHVAGVWLSSSPPPCVCHMAG